MTDDERTRARRLLLAVATDASDARVTLLHDVGLGDADAWYAIAFFVAEDLVSTMDAEYVAAQLLCGKAPSRAEAREHTIARIQHMLARALDA